MSTLAEIVGRAKLTADKEFYYDKRNGIQIPDLIIGENHKSCCINVVMEVTEIIQITRKKDKFDVVFMNNTGVYTDCLEYNNSSKTFSCATGDPRKIIQAILKNKETELYFISREHPYFNTRYEKDKLYAEATAENYGNEIQYEEFDPTLNDNADALDRKVDTVLNTPLDCDEFEWRPDRKKITGKIGTLDLTSPVGASAIDPRIKTWKKIDYSRIQEPDSDSGCDSEGCRDITAHDHTREITAAELKEIDDLFGTDAIDDLTDEPTDDLTEVPAYKSSYKLCKDTTDSLDEFTNDKTKRVIACSSFGNPPMVPTAVRQSLLYKLPLATEEEKQEALNRYRAAKILADLDLERALRESAVAYSDKLDGELLRATMLSSLDSELPSGLLIKPPKLPERADNL